MTVVDTAPVLSQEDRLDLRWGWLEVQGHRCAVCGIGHAKRYGTTARWVLDYDRGHADCPKGSECFDCVMGTTCRECMLLLRHYRGWRGNVPQRRVNGLDPVTWAARAAAYLDSDFRSLARGAVCQEDGRP